MSKSDVLIYVPARQMGGSEKVLITLHEEFLLIGFKSKLIFLTEGNGFNEFQHNDVPQSVTLSHKRTRNAILSVIFLTLKFSPKAIISSSHHLNPLLALVSLLGVKVILREPASYHFRERYKTSIIRKLNRYFVFLSYFFSKAVIFQTRPQLEEFVQIHPMLINKLHVINNPIKHKGNEIKIHNNPFDVNRCNLLSIGSLKPSKRFDVLIRAVNLLKVNIPNIHLTILGDGPMLNEIENLVIQLNLEDNITLEGFKLDTDPYYYHSDIYVLSSEIEGFPNTLLEAISFDCRIVSTDCNYGPELLLGNDYRSLVEVNDHVKMASAIIKELEEPPVKFNINEYDVSKVIYKYMSLIGLEL